MLAWYLIAQINPNIQFYAYTKSIGYLVENANSKPKNFRIVASYGSKEDALIGEHELDYAKVILHPSERGNLPIDKNEYHAINEVGSFALLLLRNAESR